MDINEDPEKVLVVDNYDSFTYNLVQYLAELGAEVLVIRNDDIAEAEVLSEVQDRIQASHILISPGPGKPSSSGISQTIIRELAGKLPILGVCLGHQAIGEIFGAKVVKAPYLMHGKTSEIFHEFSTNPIFKGIPSPFIATRYHSLIIDRDSIKGTDLIIEAETSDKLVMAISHKTHKNLLGVQFHPESILSQYGHQLLKNFIQNFS
jgi:anthranilate synthase/aminodeoxychorismate synthase-like glutamine amidotransferase